MLAGAALVLAGTGGPAAAYDNNREQLIAGRLQERIKVGTPVWLKSGSNEFLVIQTGHMTEAPLGAVILLHGLGAHPDWPGVISQLRKSLPQRGWTTVAIQLPILPPEDNIEAYGKTLDEARRRIDATLKYLAEQAIEPVVIVGYSFGGATALHYCANMAGKNTGVLGVAGISPLAQPFLRPPLKLLQEIEKIRIPVLDLYGSRDYKEVLEQAADRRLAGRKGNNPWYQQVEIEGADHNYSGLGTVLNKRISGWLKKLIEEHKARQDNDTQATEAAAGVPGETP